MDEYLDERVGQTEFHRSDKLQDLLPRIKADSESSSSKERVHTEPTKQRHRRAAQRDAAAQVSVRIIGDCYHDD